MLYFIQANSGEVKIGTSNDPYRRLEELKRQYPDKGLVLIGMLGGDELTEMVWHIAMGRLRSKTMCCEWFDLNQEMLNCIKSTVISPIPDEREWQFLEMLGHANETQAVLQLFWNSFTDENKASQFAALINKEHEK